AIALRSSIIGTSWTIRLLSGMLSLGVATDRYCSVIEQRDRRELLYVGSPTRTTRNVRATRPSSQS
ncbi:MAG: hypothetical protein QF435_14670, partial [Arenicellales bacterium]|nr:hypothetical protein [Arenicellales bacterium]